MLVATWYMVCYKDLTPLFDLAAPAAICCIGDLSPLFDLAAPAAICTTLHGQYPPDELGEGKDWCVCVFFATPLIIRCFTPVYLA